jgi:peptidoglycan/xylan/chitin deacetylase (PgdA/CDA1 family)
MAASLRTTHPHLKLTLSFDNGPDAAVTPRVLDVLARHRVQAHFYVLGQRLADEAGRELVRREVGEGHLVGNHSYSHQVPLGDDPRPDAVFEEIEKTEALLEPLAPGERRFRPFGGGGLLGPHLLSPRAVEHLCRRAYTCVLWNSVPRDWVDPGGWAAVALAGLEANAHTVMVLHDIPGACLDGLDGFLCAARELGASFVVDLPATCVPIEQGRVVGDLRPLVREAAARVIA